MIVNNNFSCFEYDALNRLLTHKDKRYVAGGTNAWVWTKRSHAYDAVGRLVASNLKSWNTGGTEPAGDSLEHCYAGSRHIQNYDGSSTYGARWHWAGAQNDHGAPLRAPSADSSAQQTYYTPSAGGAGDPQRRSFVIGGTSEGDQRLLYAQGRPMAKDAAGSGANWYLGTKSDRQVILQPDVESRLFFEGTVTATDMSRATDKREKDRLGIFGTGNSYAGSYGRVTSESIGRDLNPLGRGDGNAYLAGMINFGQLFPALPDKLSRNGTGNSINNPGCQGIGGGCSIDNGNIPRGPINPSLDIRYRPLAWQLPGQGNQPGDIQPDNSEIVPPKPGDPGYVVDPSFHWKHTFYKDDSNAIKVGPFPASEEDQFLLLLLESQELAKKPPQAGSIPTPPAGAVPCNPAKQCCCDPVVVTAANRHMANCVFLLMAAAAVACRLACTSSGLAWLICYFACIIVALILANWICCGLAVEEILRNNSKTVHPQCTSSNAWKQCLGCSS